MEHNEIEEIAIVYGKKELVAYFVEQFNIDRLYNIDRLHDGEKVKAILVKADSKKDLKHFLWKGD